MLTKKLQDYAELIRLNKPIGTLLLLWPTLTAVLLANHGHPSAGIVFIFICGVFLTRSAGCVLNDIIDRKLDKRVERTRGRPIAAGLISVKEALLLCASLVVGALILALFLNLTTVVMAGIAAILAAIYPFMKRFIYVPQVWLGIAFNWGILMAYTAVGAVVSVSGVLLYIAALLLTVAYDTMYGIVDKEDDIKVGIKSTAILFGEQSRLIIGLLQLIALLLLLIIGVITQRNEWYYFGLLTAALFGIYQHLLLRQCKPADCLRAFLNNNYLLMMVFLGALLSYL